MSNIMRLGASQATAERRAFLAIPAGSHVHPQLVQCVTQTDRAFKEAGISLEVEIIYGHCHVDDCRNLLVRDFLESDAQDMLFVDSDIGWRADDLVRLVKHDADVVAGIYPYKSDNLDFPCTLIPGEILSRNGLIEVLGVPGGFLRMSRTALEKLESVSQQYLNTPMEVDRRRVAIIFERTLENSIRYSGDYAFCRKWRALGGKVYIDPMMRFSHFGDKEYRGCFGDFLKARAGLGFERLKEITNGTETDDTLVALFEEWGNDWSAGVEFQQVAMMLAREATGQIIEFGSGLSTLVMAAANPYVPIHALESDAIWASKLNDVLDQRKITNVHLHVHPLVDYEDGRWYDMRGVPNVNYSLVLIDGPARSKGRRDIWREQLGRFADNAIWLMDDAADRTQFNSFRTFCVGRDMYVMGEQRQFCISAPMQQRTAA